MPSPRSPNGDLTPSDRVSIVGFLLQQAENFKLPYGAIADAASRFGCSTKTVGKLWRKAAQSLQETSELPDFAVSGRSKSGRKKKYDDIADRIKLVPLRKRSNIRSVSKAISIPKSTVMRALQSGEIKRHSSSVKPLLTDVNRMDRLSFCLSFVDKVTHAFEAMDNRIHIDEKWFYLTRENQTYYLATDEELPYRAVKSKRFITKVMFMAAVMRPVIENGVVVFDGKLGIWPFVTTEPAQRTSKNRPAGTLETKSVVVTREQHRDMLLSHVIPAIKTKVPGWMRERLLIIQQDGARSHVLTNDPAVSAACGEGGWNIQLEKQPANSPDLNILDLGFFCSIQALQHEQAPASTDELIACTQKAFEELSASKLNDTFLSLQHVMECIIADFGGNNYKLPHMGKNRLRTQGLLPQNRTCDELAYLAGIAYRFLSSA